MLDLGYSLGKGIRSRSRSRVLSVNLSQVCVQLKQSEES